MIKLVLNFNALAGVKILHVLRRRSGLDVASNIRTIVSHGERLADGYSDSTIESRAVYEMHPRNSFTCGQNVRVNDNLLSENSLTTQETGR